MKIDADSFIDERDRREIERILVARLGAPLNSGVRVFGSRARGDARRTSDIDLAIDSPGLSAADLATLREALEDSRVPFRIDLVDYATASPEVRAAIDRESIAWPA